MTIYIIIFIWLLLGYAGWRFEYYGSIKHWYTKFHEDCRINTPDYLRFWKYFFPFVLAFGPLSFIFMIVADCKWIWYFKVPRKRALEEYIIQ